MPALGADMEAGTLVEWLVKPGDHVRKGDVIAVVETQKGAIEVEIFDEGIVSEIVAPIGTRVPVGGLLAHIGGHIAEQLEKPTPVQLKRETLPQPTFAPLLHRRIEPVLRGVKITPVARRRATQLRVDVGALTGTGVDGAVTLADVEAAAAVPRPETTVAP